MSKPTEPRQQADRSTWLLRMIWVRVLAFTVFVLAQPDRTPDMLVLLGAVFALSFCWFALLRLNRAHVAQAYAQIGIDLLLITWTVHLTGGIDSYFSSLYFLEIVVSSILLNRRGASTTALVSAGLHGTHLTLMYLQILPTTGSLPDPTAYPTTIGLTLVGYCTVGYLTDYLAEKGRASSLALKESTGQVAFLQALTGHIIDSLGSGLATTDLEGRIYVFNPEASRITGRRADEAVGQRIGEIFPNLPAEPEVGKFEITATDPAGKPVCLDFTVTPLTMHSGASTGYVWCFDDVTGIREMENELRRRERMAAIGTMSAGIAHEIRNPLASITGSFNLLRSELVGEEQQELGEIISREAQRLNQIIKDFLLYARPVVPRRKRVELDRLISDSVQLMRNSTDLCPGHKIETDLAPVTASVDEDQLRQVFYNLASNAFRAMPESGTLTIRLRRQGNRIDVEFTDTGSGMTSEQIDRVFVPFNSSFPTGTGLGLAIVYQIVQSHGGSITVRSRVGRGTTFTVEIPAVKDVPVAAPTEEAARTHQLA